MTVFRTGKELIIDVMLPGNRRCDGANRLVATVTAIQPDLSAAVQINDVPELVRIRSTDHGDFAVFDDGQEATIDAIQ